jgi:hypothetical protein
LREIGFSEYQPVSADIEQYLPGSSRQPAASGIPGYITERQFADQLGLSIATIRRWRRQGYGPAWVKIGRRDYTRENGAREFADELLGRAQAQREPRRGRPRARR